jgi:hypothetical protein
MKYYFTTLSINEEYFKESLKFFIDLHDKTELSLLNITTTDEDLKKIKDYVGLTLEEFYSKYPRIKITTLESFNHKIKYQTQSEGNGFVFNVNLKVLSIKTCLNSKEDFDYIIYVDGDWQISDGFEESKFITLFNQMDNSNIDFVFERPARIGDDRVKPETSFYRDKIYDYDILDHDLYDNAHVANEQILVFRKNWKLKVFTQKWEQMLWYSIANGIRNYAEGFEIGISALESKMKWSWTMFPILSVPELLWLIVPQVPVILPIVILPEVAALLDEIAPQFTETVPMVTDPVLLLSIAPNEPVTLPI